MMRKMLMFNFRRAVGAATLLTVFAPMAASASTILTELTLNSSPPANSPFAGGTMTGTVQLWTTDSANNIVPLGSPTQFPSVAANSEGILTWVTQAGPCWLDLAGLIGEGQTEFQMFAFPPNSVPPGPPIAPPLVEIGMLNGALFEEATGPLVGFDSAQQIGTWTITEQVTPLPATLPLFATGLGALSLLGWRRRRKVSGRLSKQSSNWSTNMRAKTMILIVAVAAVMSFGFARANTITTFAVSGTAQNEISITHIGDGSGCAAITCNNYAPGTFHGTITIDLTTDAITAADITAGVGLFGNEFASPPSPNLGSGLNLVVDQFVAGSPSPVGPLLSLSVDLLNDSVSGHVSGVTGVSPDSGFGADFVKDMVGSISTTPLPAALPLFATGLAGLGLLGWRRKRKAQAVT